MAAKGGGVMAALGVTAWLKTGRFVSLLMEILLMVVEFWAHGPEKARKKTRGAMGTRLGSGRSERISP